MRGDRVLVAAMLVYGVASLAHFVHNGVYIDSYPNLPEWLTSAGVYLSWLVIGGTGALGYWLLRRVSRPAGLAVIAVYALLGFAGLDHYAVAPVDAHATAMNATIVAEVIAAGLLLLVVGANAAGALRARAAPR